MGRNFLVRSETMHRLTVRLAIHRSVRSGEIDVVLCFSQSREILERLHNVVHSRCQAYYRENR